MVFLLLAVGCSPTDEPTTEPPDTPTATPEPAPPPDPTGQWTSCTSPDGYTIDYPADWVTNDEPIDDVAPCSLFDPDTAQLRTEGMQLPADVAVAVSVEAAPFHDVTAENPHAEELDRRTDTVDGRDAVRIQQEATGEGLYPPGCNRIALVTRLASGVMRRPARKRSWVICGRCSGRRSGTHGPVRRRKWHTRQRQGP